MFGNAWLRTSDARDKYRTPAPAQPHNHSMPYLIFSPLLQQTNMLPVFFLSRALQPMRLPAAVGSSTASSAPEEAVAGSSAWEAVGAPLRAPRRRRRPQGAPPRATRRGRRGGAPPDGAAAAQADDVELPDGRPHPRPTGAPPWCKRRGRRRRRPPRRALEGGLDSARGDLDRGGTWREGELSTASGAPRSSVMCAGGARGARGRVCGACCKRMCHVFQMSHKNVARVSCGCCKSRSRFFNIADVDPQHKRLIPDVATICFRMLRMLQLLVTYF
jgi:hypothetical protein